MNRFFMWFFGIVSILNAITVVVGVIYHKMGWFDILLYSTMSLDLVVMSIKSKRKLEVAE